MLCVYVLMRLCIMTSMVPAVALLQQLLVVSTVVLVPYITATKVITSPGLIMPGGMISCTLPAACVAVCSMDAAAVLKTLTSANKSSTEMKHCHKHHNLYARARRDFAAVTNLSRREKQCLWKRAVLDNVVTRKECNALAELMTLGQKFMSAEGKKNDSHWADFYKNLEEHLNDTDSEINATQWETGVKQDFGYQELMFDGLERLWNSTQNDAAVVEKFLLFVDVRQRLHKIIKQYFNVPNLLVESTHFTNRSADTLAHGMHGHHADNCDYDWASNTCYRKEHCCMNRDYTAVLFLNDNGVDHTGGRFVFRHTGLKDECDQGEDDMIPLPPKCGRMVFFSSGGENVHGVETLYSGYRLTMATWYTFSEAHAEQLDVQT